MTIGGIGGASFDAAEALETDTATLSDLAFDAGTEATAIEIEALSANLGIPPENLTMYDQDTVIALFALSKAMDAVKNGTAIQAQIDILKRADSFLDALYACCTGNGVAGDGSLTLGIIQAFKSFTGNLAEGDRVGEVTLTAADIAEMSDGFTTEDEGGTYVTDETDFAQADTVSGGVFEPIPFPGLSTGPAYPGSSSLVAADTVPGVEADTPSPAGGADEEPSAADAAAGGGNKKGDVASGANARHDHNGDGLLDHDVKG